MRWEVEVERRVRISKRVGTLTNDFKRGGDEVGRSGREGVRAQLGRLH